MNCNYCESTTIECLISDTKSTYTYCTNCNDSYETAHKHLAIDSVLKRVKSFLEFSSEEGLKIQVKNKNDFMELIINDEKVFEIEFNYEFKGKDIYYLENIIHDLVEDYYEFDVTKIDIIVCE